MNMARCLILAVGLALATASAQAADYGSITGQVKMPDAPKPAPIAGVAANPDQAHCLSKGPLFDRTYMVDDKTKGLKGVIVWLRPASKDRRAEFPKDQIHPNLQNPKPTKHEVDQPCCEFIPKIIAIRAGDTILFKNGAPVNHNINFTSSSDNFNVNLPPGGSKETTTMADQSTPFTYACNIHPWMTGKGRVFDHPYFAVTDENGKFELKDVPVGDWNIMYWHETGYYKGRDGILGFPLKVKAKAETTLEPIDFTVK